jgi:ABC-type multidrug transport system ATPase subunit
MLVWLRAGPSGSGKTSLLSVMGARAQKMMRTDGAVTFNGAPLTKRLKRRIGYVLQVGGCGLAGGQ